MSTSHRPLAMRSAGQLKGPIARLVSPGQEGLLLNPFVLLDYVGAPAGIAAIRLSVRE
jgi:hypothetical protein